MMKLTQEDLKKILRYDPDLGRFFWLYPGKGKRLNRCAGSFDAHGYGQIRFDGEIYKEHRLVWLYVTGEWPNGQIDHENHDRRDNRFSNLRIVDNMENHRNRPMQRNNLSGFVGVAVCKKSGMYDSFIHVSGKKINLGRFSKIQDAINARVAANEKYGFHENHGIGQGVSRKVLNKTKRMRSGIAGLDD